MKKSIERFLEFEGKSISILLVDGTWWVALKPICHVLNVNYERQRQNIQDDEILCQLPTEQQVVAADGRLRKMICLPEMAIYGWIFSIRSDSEELKKYKFLCYKVLYNYFHGTITGRMNILNSLSDEALELLDLQEKLDAKLENLEEYKRIQEIKSNKKNYNKKLKELDTDLMKGQTLMNFN